MATGNDRRAKVLVLDADRKHAAELSHRLRFLDYDPIIADSADALSDDVTAVIIDGDAARQSTIAMLRRSFEMLHRKCQGAKP